MEGRDPVSMGAQLVTEDPVLVGCVVPGVDLLHLRAVEQGSTAEVAACGLGLGGAIVTTVGTGVIFGSTVSDTCVGTLHTSVAATEVLVQRSLRCTFAEAILEATIGTGDMLNPGVSNALVTIAAIALVRVWRTDITTDRDSAWVGVEFTTAFGSTITGLAPATFL